MSIAMNPFAQVGQESLAVIKAHKQAKEIAAAAAKQAKLESIYERAKPYLDVLCEEITPDSVREKIIPTDPEVVYMSSADFPIPDELIELLTEFCRIRRNHSDSAQVLAELAQEVTPKLARTFRQIEEANFQIWVGTNVISLMYNGAN
jgi:hypothetical protein